MSSSPDLAAIRETIGAVLTAGGLTLGIVAERAGVSLPELSRFIGGKHAADPASPQCRRMQRALASSLGPDGAALTVRLVSELRRSRHASG